jgi:hypothetical protein
VASQDGWAGSGSVDPAFAELFRAEDSPVVPDSSPEAAPSEALAGDVLVEHSSPEVPAESSVDTGRLFRSQGVQGHSSTVLALGSDHGGRLRTLARTEVDPGPAATPDHVPLPTSDPVHAALPPNEDVLLPPVVEADAPSGRPARRQRSQVADGLTALAVYLLIIGVTLIVAFTNALLLNGKVGWPTGLALVVVTVFCALKVRRDDDLVTIITPPIAFFLAAVTAAQLFLGSAQHSLLNRAVVAFFTLADNWVWIIGATVAAVVIVLVRRRR